MLVLQHGCKESSQHQHKDKFDQTAFEHLDQEKQQPLHFQLPCSPKRQDQTKHIYPAKYK